MRPVSVVVIALGATLCMQVGYLLWKISARGQPRIGVAPPLQVARALLGDWRWLSGLAATIAGWLLFIRATTLGDISLVQPLMTVGDVFLIFLAVAFLHERMSRQEWLGIAVTIAGAATLAFDPSASPGTHIDSTSLLGLLAASLAAAGALLLAVRRGARGELALALTVGLAFGCGATLTKAMTSAAATTAAATAPPMPWEFALDPMLLAVMAANVAGLVLLQAAFQRGRAAVIVPLQLAVTNGVAVAGGMLVFAEHVSPTRWCGIGAIVLGTAVLHRGSRN